MNSLYIITENFSNGYIDEILDFIYLVSIFSGIFVIISKNPIVSVLFLIGLFLSIASYLIILGISFIGLSYLLVYVGAVSILFLFILMLINIRISELLSNTSNSILLAVIIAICFNYTVNQVLPHSLAASPSLNNILDLSNLFNGVLDTFSFNNSNYIYIKFLNVNNYKGEVLFVTSKIWDGSLAETTHITSIGYIIYTSYMIWLINTSIILLLAMVGAIVITIKQKS